MKHRNCEICGTGDRRVLYRQRFMPLDDGSTFTGYDVAICKRCGHGYADDIPEQDFYDRYYGEMSKYEAFRPAKAIDASHSNYTGVVAALTPHFPARQTRILDIGTGAGHLLGSFKAAGYGKLLGIDPSPKCAADARERYGVKVIAAPVSQMKMEGKRFDLVLLTNVVEHLRDVVGSLRDSASILSPGGAVFIDAPDAERFAEYVAAPFQQFSLEHINYFAMPSIENAFRGIGFTSSALWQDVRRDGRVREPVLCGLFRKTDEAQKLERDDVTERALIDYIHVSREAEHRLSAQLAKFSASHRPLIVWGVGTLTLRLLETDAFRTLNIVAFVDSNKNYQGKSVSGKPILAPEMLANRNEAILISSGAHREEIANQIRHELCLSNPVVSLLPTLGADTA